MFARRWKVLLLTVLISRIALCEASRILGIFPFHGKSHAIMTNALMKGLARRGHQVHIISHYPSLEPMENYTIVVNLNGTIKGIVGQFSVAGVLDDKFQSNIAMTLGTLAGNDVCELLGTDVMQNFIKSLPNSEPYDLIITEVFGAHCYMGFGHLLKLPVVGVATCLEFSWMAEMIGNPVQPALYPDAYSHLRAPLNFWGRLQNTLSVPRSKYNFQKVTQVQTDLMRKYLSPDMPDIREVEKILSLLLVNTHHSQFEARPVVPALVEVAGLHVEDKESKSSPEVQKWLDESTEGLVYFTLGSLINIETFPNATLSAIYTCFSKIAPIRVLMKITNAESLPEGLPKNVKILPWLPQVQILKHPNTKAFITHGGLMSLQEAQYYGIPLVGIPLFADQYLNVVTYVDKKMAVSLYHNEITVESLGRALNAVLHDPSYWFTSKPKIC
ncbi:UDP-glucuronosyltransferase 2B31-like isoform X2 [Cephus cinctus]|uniref:UDP-glucuronosyltransferase 2B31-like isoform X2 n=1 Tax=Cephus cinctus TaxID=211228 RepID=A0AAJ7C9M0_CEPCN|nr:UDP-glucuronosyltransferase 2B31-like isoform X2 [Cephus cinctus]